MKITICIEDDVSNIKQLLEDPTRLSSKIIEAFEKTKKEQEKILDLANSPIQHKSYPGYAGRDESGGFDSDFYNKQ